MKLTEQDQDIIRAAHGPLWLELAALCAAKTGGTRLFYLDAYARMATLPDERYLDWDETVIIRRFAALEDVRTVDGSTFAPEPIRIAVLVSYGDYSSSTDIDAANYRWLRDSVYNTRPDPLLLDVGHSESDGLGLAVRIGDSRWSAADLTELISIVANLADYPLIADDVHAEYESEKREE